MKEEIQSCVYESFESASKDSFEQTSDHVFYLYISSLYSHPGILDKASPEMIVSILKTFNMY